MSKAKYEWPAPGGTPPTLDEHSAAKHAVIRNYVARYIDILTADLRQDHLRLNLVDGFAGGGRYLYRGQPARGSPLILLDEVDQERGRRPRRDGSRSRLTPASSSSSSVRGPGSTT